jgi:phosphate transport system substrate-binding protein
VVTTLSAQPFVREITDRALTGPTPFSITLAASQAEALAAAHESAIGIMLFIPDGTGLWATPLGEEPIAVIVNQASPIDGLTLAQLQDIYAGRDTMWAAAAREDGDDSRLFFEAVALRGLRPAATISLAPSPEAMIRFVSETPNALGYLPLGWADERVKVIAIDGLAPTDEGYPLIALVVAVSKSEPGGPARDWLINVQSGGGK